MLGYQPNMPAGMFFILLPIPYLVLLAAGLLIEKVLGRHGGRSARDDFYIGFSYAFPMLVSVHMVVLILVGIFWNPIMFRLLLQREKVVRAERTDDQLH